MREDAVGTEAHVRVDEAEDGVLSGLREGPAGMLFAVPARRQWRGLGEANLGVLRG